MKPLSPRAIDAAGLADGTYGFEVVGGKVKGLTVTSGGTSGGGATHSYVGTSTPGANWSAMTNNRVYYKRIVLAKSGLLANVEAYIQNTGPGVDTHSAAVFADLAGAPGDLLSAAVNPATSIFVAPVNGGRWFGIPQGTWLVAGTYWIGWGVLNDVTITQQIAYDTGGTDVYTQNSGAWMADGNYYSNVATGNNISIRASVLTP